MARKKILDIQPFKSGEAGAKKQPPFFLFAAVAILFLIALAGVFMLYQSEKQLPGSMANPAAPPGRTGQMSIPSCNNGQAQPCEISGCIGNQTCRNGFYSDCALPRKICVPFSKIGCSSDSCKFGYAICNPCGTGYGVCLPPPANATNSSPPCSGAGCN